MRDSAFTGKTVCLEPAVTSKCATYEQLKHAVLDKLQIFVSGPRDCLELDGKALPRDRPLDRGLKSAQTTIMLTLTLDGLLGGADKDDDFQRVKDEVVVGAEKDDDFQKVKDESG